MHSNLITQGPVAAQRAAVNRDGHGIPKCSPFPSVVFLCCRVRPSVSVIFLGWRVRMSVIQTSGIPKIGKIGAKIRASVY